jgi:hypothetical protein
MIIGTAFLVLGGEHGGANGFGAGRSGNLQFVDLYLEVVKKNFGSDIFAVLRVRDILLDAIKAARESS